MSLDNAIPATKMTAKDLATAIYNTKFHYKDEKELQRGIGILLTQLGLTFEAEHLLSAWDRIDFLVGDIGIEVKVDSPQSLVTRQLWRYSKCSEIQSLILVTTRSKHLSLPAEMNGKTIYHVHLLHSFL